MVTGSISEAGLGYPPGVPVLPPLRPRPSPLLSVVVLASCLGRSTVGSDEIVVGIGSNPSNLDPRFAPDAFSDRISRLIFSTLVLRGEGGNLEPGLATQWRWRDERTLEFKLRDGVRFHDGTAFDAGDVRATLESVRDPALGSVKRQALDALDAVEVQDAMTLVLRLKRAEASFVSSLTGIGIAPSEALAGPVEEFRSTLPGTGAFRFVEAVADQHVLLARVDDSWVGRPKVERLRFRIVPDATVRVLELMHGGIDVLQNDLPPHVVERLRHEGDLRVESTPSSLVKYLVFQTEKGALRDVAVRRAIAASIDRGPIVRYRLRGLASPTSGFFLDGHWASVPTLPTPSFDPRAAERALDAAGVRRDSADGVRLRLVFRTSMDDNAVAVARILRRQLGAVGIEVDVRPSEWGVFFSDIKQGEFDLFTITGVGIHDPDWLSFVAHSRSIPPAGANRARYRDDAVDALLDLGRRHGSEVVRGPLYAAAQRRIAEDVPLLPLWFEHNVVASRRNVEGYHARTDADFVAFVSARKAEVAP